MVSKPVMEVVTQQKKGVERAIEQDEPRVDHHDKLLEMVDGDVWGVTGKRAWSVHVIVKGVCKREGIIQRLDACALLHGLTNAVFHVCHDKRVIGVRKS